MEKNLNVVSALPNESIAFGFDALQILDNEVKITMGEETITLETLKDINGRIISVNYNGKSREVTYV